MTESKIGKYRCQCHANITESQIQPVIGCDIKDNKVRHKENESRPKILT